MIEQALIIFLKSVTPDEIIDADSSLQALQERMSQIQQQHPKLFINQLPSLLQILHQYSNIEILSRCQLLEIALQGVSDYPSAVKKNTGRIQQCFNAIFSIMTSINYEVSPQWFHPEEGFDFDDMDNLKDVDTDSAVMMKCLGMVDKLASTVQYENFLGVVLSELNKLYETEDWRYKFATVMTISQISQDINNMQKISPFLNFVGKAAYNDHPKVRYSAAQAIGQLAEDLKPKFQDEFSNDVIPIMLNGIQDKEERVASHWFACMTNFFEDYTDLAKMQEYLGEIISAIEKQLNEGFSGMKQNCISTLASIGSVSGLFTHQTIKKPIQLCNHVLSSHSPVGIYKQLTNQTIECLTIVLGSQPKVITKQYIPYTMETFLQVSEHLSLDYFFAAWRRLCFLYEPLENWGKVYEKVLKKTLEANEQENTENVQAGIQAIESTVDLVGGAFEPMMTETLQSLKAISEKWENDFNSSIIDACISAIIAIFCKIQEAKPNPNMDKEAVNAVNYYMGKISLWFDEENYKSVENLISQMQNLLQKHIHAFKEVQLQGIWDSIINLLPLIEGKKASMSLISAHEMQQEVDPDLFIETNKEVASDIFSLKLAIPDFLKIIAKSMKNEEMINWQINEAESILKTDNLEDKDYQYALYYLDNIVEEFSFQELKPVWGKIYDFLKKECLNKVSVVRNASAYGFGVMISKIPPECVTMELINQWVNIITQTYLIPKHERDKKKQYNHCQDNCVAVVGKIIKSFIHHLPIQHLCKSWVQKLPLKYDKSEGNLQIRYLFDLLNSNPEYFISNAEDLTEIFIVLANYINVAIKKVNKEENVQNLKRSKQILQKLGNCNLFQENSSSIQNSIPKKSLDLLDNLINKNAYV